MNGDELELMAAANRLADEKLEDWQGTSGDCANMRAAIKLARWYRADHPADDGEAITVEWLKSVGFRRFMQPANGQSLSITVWPVVISRWVNKGGLPVMWSVKKFADEPDDWLTQCLTPVTRGDVRRLCRALGVQLNEGNQS